MEEHLTVLSPAAWTSLVAVRHLQATREGRQEVSKYRYFHFLILSPNIATGVGKLKRERNLFL